MSREIQLVVAPAVDVQQVAREISGAVLALQDIDRQLDSTERKATGLRDEQARRRIEIGRLLIDAKRGIRHGGWLPFLEKLGITQQNAHRWMELAGFTERGFNELEAKSRTDKNVRDLPQPPMPTLLGSGTDTPDPPARPPTLRDAGIDKRPRKSDTVDGRKAEVIITGMLIGRLSRLTVGLKDMLPQMTPADRDAAVQLLRELIRTIEVAP